MWGRPCSVSQRSNGPISTLGLDSWSPSGASGLWILVPTLWPPPHLERIPRCWCVCHPHIITVLCPLDLDLLSLACSICHFLHPSSEASPVFGLAGNSHTFERIPRSDISISDPLGLAPSAQGSRCLDCIILRHGTRDRAEHTTYRQHPFVEWQATVTFERIPRCGGIWAPLARPPLRPRGGGTQTVVKDPVDLFPEGRGHGARPWSSMHRTTQPSSGPSSW